MGETFSTFFNFQPQSEKNKSKYLQMPIDMKRNLYKCGSNYVTLDMIPTWDEYAMKHGLILSDLAEGYIFKRELNTKIRMFTGDITCIELDCIVNAANSQLAGGGGVNGAIHFAAGHNLLQAECRSLGGCNIGSAKITGGYKLPAKYVIHTVGPVQEDSSLLASCYKTCLDIMAQYRLKSIAFPCISTGIYGYPNENATRIALRTVREWLDTNEYSKNVTSIVFCLFLKVDIDIYHKLMPVYFPPCEAQNVNHKM